MQTAIAARRWPAWLAALVFALAPPLVGAAQDEEVVAVGDTVSVTVYGEPDLAVAGAKVKRAGSIGVPLIGEVRVVGLTAAQITDEITARFLDGYLKKPSVTVDVDKFHLYYIKGEVRKPGGYRFVENLSVEKAIALAGGFTERAAHGDIRLTRNDAGTGPQTVRDPTTLIAPGDVITVGESFF